MWNAIYKIREKQMDVEYRKRREYLINELTLLHEYLGTLRDLIMAHLRRYRSNKKIQDEDLSWVTANGWLAKTHELLGNIILSSIDEELLTVGILSRSLIDIMGNIVWVFQDSDQGEMQKRLKIVESKISEHMDFMTKFKGNTSGLTRYANERFDLICTDWNEVYKNLSSYTHVNLGFDFHLINSTKLGALNSILLFDIIAACNVIEVALKELPFIRRDDILDEIKLRMEKDLNDRAAANFNDLYCY